MRVILDRDRCQGVGICESIRPDVFELDDAGELEVHTPVVRDAADRNDLQQAVEACPTQALSLAE